MAANVKLTPLSAGDWSPRHARHLLNRAGFGVPEREVARLAKLDPAGAVAELVNYGQTADTLVAPDFLITAEDYAEYREAIKGLPEEERRKLNNELQARERGAILRLQAWWVERFVNTPRPLQEKMTLFWHGHFATSAQKVKASRANYHFNDLLRQHATGNFKAFTTAVGQSPAMLRYLDNVQNVKGSPNENWARELMELFTLGQGQYTEQDIKESARAFTGWASNGEGGFTFREDKHDFGPKTFMGRTGDFDGWDIINIIFEQPAAAEFISAKLWSFLAYENPEPELVSTLGHVLRKNNFEIAPLLRAIFTSDAFYSEKAMGTQIKSPTQFLVQLSHDLALESPPYVALARAAGQLGQQLFYPPNVAGWDGGRRWINANTLLGRYNMSRHIVVADFFEPDEMSMMDMRAMQGGVMGRAAQSQFKAALKEAPADQQKAVRAKMAEAVTPEARRAILEETMIDLEAGKRWNVQAIFGGIEFSTPAECADALAARYLSTPLVADQRAILLNALAPGASPDATLTRESLTNDQMTSALHLLFSLAEYQLC